MTAATSTSASGTRDVRDVHGVPLRLTGTASGGGCACKIPPGELEEIVAALPQAGPEAAAKIVVGVETGDDGAAVRIDDRTNQAVIVTADFFTPVVDDPYDWGRIAAANALSDIYAMGGVPLVAVNLLSWPRARLPLEIAAEVLRGGARICADAGVVVGGGHTIDDPEPKYGQAVTGIGQADLLLRNDAARAGLPLTLTKPLGLGVLNNRHKATGEYFDHAVEIMTTLNAEASRAALEAGISAATDVTGFGLLGHLFKMLRASGVSARIDAAAVPYLEGARASLAEGFVPGGSRRNLDWVRPHLDPGPGISEEELILLADAQTSGGLLVVGELPGHPVIGEILLSDGVSGPGESRIEVR